MMQRVSMWAIAAAILLPAAASAQCCIPRGGCSDPCLTGNCGVAVSSMIVPGVRVGGATVATGSPVVTGSAGSQSLCGPVASYKVVMKPQYVTESRAQCATEYREEKRYRTSIVYNTVPVVEEHYRVKTIHVPKTETKTVEYTELVAEKTERTVETIVSVPQWKEVTETYMVQVPVLVDVPETYTVQVPQLRDETFTYTVNVPYTHTETKLKTVNNAVPVTKTRVVKVCVPTTKTETVTKDYGHWETRVEEVYVGDRAVSASGHYTSRGCGSHPGMSCGGCTTRCQSCNRCGSCGSACRSCGSHSTYAGCGHSYAGCGVAHSAAPLTRTVARRVWVPNVRTETVTVPSSETQEHIVNYTVYEQQIEQVPYECTYVAYRPETRTGTKKVVDYVAEQRTRLRKAVQYTEEPRTRTRRELTYRQETQTETYPFVSYRQETRTKEIRYTVNEPQSVVEPYTTTRYDRVPAEKVETYIVRVPVTVLKEVQVQVCRMVPQLVPETINPCNAGWSNVGPSSVYSSGTSILLHGNSGCSGCATGCSGCATIIHDTPLQPSAPLHQETILDSEITPPATSSEAVPPVLDAEPTPPAAAEAEEVEAEQVEAEEVEAEAETDEVSAAAAIEA